MRSPRRWKIYVTFENEYCQVWAAFSTCETHVLRQQGVQGSLQRDFGRVTGSEPNQLTLTHPPLGASAKLRATPHRAPQMPGLSHNGAPPPSPTPRVNITEQHPSPPFVKVPGGGFPRRPTALGVPSERLRLWWSPKTVQASSLALDCRVIDASRDIGIYETSLSSGRRYYHGHHHHGLHSRVKE